MDEIAVVDSNDAFVWFKGRPAAETNLAFKFSLQSGKTIWVPKSKLRDDREMHCIPRWLAVAKGIGPLNPKTLVDVYNLPRFDYKFDGPV